MFSSDLVVVVVVVGCWFSVVGCWSWRVLGGSWESWGCFGASSEHLGGVVGSLGSVLGCLGVCWEHLGGVFRAQVERGLDVLDRLRWVFQAFSGLESIFN